MRGGALEELVNMTNDVYRARGLALIQKLPTPITPVQMNRETGNIELAYFERKSTVDYIGVVQGVPVAFDAKETSRKNLPMDNIHPHQIEFMQEFEQQRGLAFLIVRFSLTRQMFLLPFENLMVYWENAAKGGRKSIPLADFTEEMAVHSSGRAFVHYLEALSNYLKTKGM